MKGFDIFLMDYTFALRILIFLRHTDAYNAFTESEQTLINRDIIDDALISNIKNYLRWDMFQNDGADQMIHLFWEDSADHYDMVEILYNVAAAVGQIVNHEELIKKHIQIITKLDMAISIHSNKAEIAPSIKGIYQPATFAYFLDKRKEIIAANKIQCMETADFYYPCPYTNEIADLKTKFQHLIARTYYLGSIDTYSTSFGNDHDPEMFDQKSVDAFVDHISKCAKKAGNNNTIANTDIIKQLIKGRYITIFNKNSLDNLCISITDNDSIILPRYENYYLWIQGLYHNEARQAFNFFFSVYDPFQNFFTQTFTVAQSNGRHTGGNHIINPTNSLSMHCVYFIVFLIVILFMFYLIWEKNKWCVISQRPLEYHAYIN